MKSNVKKSIISGPVLALALLCTQCLVNPQTAHASGDPVNSGREWHYEGAG